MNLPGLDIDARVDGASFALRERIPLIVTLTNTGSSVVRVPDPVASDGDAWALVLTRPDGSATRLPLNQTGVPAGGMRQILMLGVLPSEPLVLRFNVASLFHLIAPGDHSLVVECTLSPGQTYRSSDIPFTLRAPSPPAFFEVAPAEAASRGYQAIVWAEGGSRALQFDDGQRPLDPFGAHPVASVPAGARPVVSTAVAGQPQMDRWLAWLSADGSLVTTFTTETPGRAVAPRTSPLPPAGAPFHILSPVLADNEYSAPAADVDADAETEEEAPAPPPTASIGLLGAGASGGMDLVLARVDASGAALFERPVPFSQLPPEKVLGAWATSPSVWSRVFVVALPAPSGVLVRGVSIQPRAAVVPVDLATIDADEFLLGDVRCDLRGQVWIGLLVRRGAKWARVSFTPPVRDKDKDLRTEILDPGPGAQVAAIRLDTEGRLHVVYRASGELRYAGPGSASYSWARADLAASASHEHIVLRGPTAATLVYHGRDIGLGFERMG